MKIEASDAERYDLDLSLANGKSYYMHCIATLPLDFNVDA